ncbi:MAG: hypothetical protein WC641_07520 [Patescibacteria group bacterium]
MPALFRSSKKVQQDHRFAIGLAMAFVVLCTFAFLVLVAKVKMENALRTEAQTYMVRRIAALEGRLAASAAPAATAPKATTQTKPVGLDKTAVNVKLGESALDALGNSVKFTKLGTNGSIRIEAKGIAPAAKTGDVVLLPGECKPASTFVISYESLSIDASGTTAKLVTAAACK